jgi:hypothetical protein
MTIQDLFRHTAGFAYGEFSNVAEIKAAYAEAKLYQPGITAESRMDHAGPIRRRHRQGATGA